jgi:TolB-like protein/tetratricopeptide (TPR) repeat protein
MADRAEPEDLHARAANATATAEPLRVFVSYASPDAAVAGALVESLERHGIACWIAPRDVKAGALYADAIVRAISGAKALVLVLSENAIGSSHVGKEIERASSKKRPIIALRIDNAPLTPALEYFLSESQWVEAQAENKEFAYATVIDAIREPEGATPGINPAVTPSADTASGVQSKERRNRILFAAILIVVAVALAGLLVAKFTLSKHVAAERQMIAATDVVSGKSIAVLPFTDMSEKRDQEYFGDGIAEEVLDLLTKIPGLTVIGRTSSFQFKGKSEDLRTIGAKLNAAYVLEGSVRRSGDQLRITAQLINSRTGASEWSETYDRHIGDVLTLEDAIAAAVVRELQLHVASGYVQSRATLKNADVYDMVLRGRQASDRGDKEGYGEAITLFQQALDRDPSFADAAAWLGWAYEGQGEDGFLAPAAAFVQARRAAVTALRLEPKNVVAHYLLGRINIVYDWDWAAAQRELQQVVMLVPGSARAHHAEGELSLVLGRSDDALRQFTAALAQDPVNPGIFTALSWLQAHRGHLPEAESAARRVLEIRPTMSGGHFYLGGVLLARGDLDTALLEMQQETSEVAQQEGLAMAYHALGRKSESDAALARMLKEQADENAFGIAEVYAFRGQADEAMHWLERAYAQKDVGLYYIKVDLQLQSLAADPRFRAFLRKMNLPD